MRILHSLLGCVAQGTGILLLSLALLGRPAEVQAQTALFTQPGEAVGVAVWYGWGRFKVDAPPDSASPEVIGYTDILPSSITGVGPAIGVSFSSWGVNIGFSSFDVDLGGVKADINQTPGDPLDDVTVLAARGRMTSLVVLFQPVRWFYAGYGQERGNIEFIQTSASGQPETRRLPIDNPFYTFGFALGFDPTRDKVAPIVTIFAKIPAERGDFSGTTTGAGIGLFF